MKKGLSNRRGEVFTATAVKVIIAVVVGVLILGGLFALYRNVIFPKLNQKVEGMIHTEDTVQVRKDGNSVQYSYDGETWKDCTIPGLSASATVSTVLTRTYQELVYFDARTKIHLQNYLEGRTDENPALFVSLKAPFDRLMIGGVETRLRELGKRLNIPKVHPHKFRRTLATTAIDKGMPIEQVQQLLGHQKIDTTMHYAMVKQQNVKLAHRKYIG